MRRGGAPLRVRCCRWEIDCRPQRLANTPTISQATPDSFLPRWGKKPWGWVGAVGTGNQKGSLVQGATEGSACAVGTTPKALATRSRQPKRVQPTAVGCTTIEVAEHNAEGVNDPQSSTETSAGHGSGLYDD